MPMDSRCFSTRALPPPMPCTLGRQEAKASRCFAEDCQAVKLRVAPSPEHNRWIQSGFWRPPSRMPSVLVSACV